jgi:ABC-type dipeptide/oligopeptide/nickel transport system permease component
VTISRDDIEAKARQIVSAIDETKESAKNTAVLAGVAIAVVVVIAFVMGRRRGRRSKTLVEVYRV